eukprot:CAMPEP_0116911572 /NCGR_PEP_ID=MMETSP0467-20121206/15564_1 /TAXON_ID=283647 /ORGANISM="Mesodinium pulex, Strain SPMC105" /LENGTH=93 /DNA_ID=CAMNT_0004587373 /DNA_START=1660 /DNA_END=1941 /DNA_ORIENTATION=-
MRQKTLNESNQQQSTRNVNKHSDTLFEKKKQKKFEEIFEVLDGDADGRINAENIDIETINPELLAIINQCLVEMEQKAKTLDKKSFTSGLHKL